MKNRLFNKPFLTFALGLLLGASLMTIYAFSGSTMPPATSATAITLNDAIQLTDHFTAKAKPFQKVLRGTAVSIEQLEAMNKIFATNPSFSGFRIYNGLTTGNQSKMIVVGIDKQGKDATGKTMYSTGADGSGPCPTVCDSDSPL